MLRDRYDPYCLFDAVPRLALRFEPELAAVDRLLDDDALFRLVRDDLVRRRPRTAVTGRPSTPVEVVLRMLVVKHLHGWSYEQTERFVADSLVLRQFCRLAPEPVPHRTTLLRWANLVQPATLHGSSAGRCTAPGASSAPGRPGSSGTGPGARPRSRGRSGRRWCTGGPTASGSATACTSGCWPWPRP